MLGSYVPGFVFFGVFFITPTFVLQRYDTCHGISNFLLLFYNRFAFLKTEFMKYSQVTAMLAVTKASLRSIMRSPSAIVFSFVFPFVFIIVFGFIGNSGGRQTFRVVLKPGSDTSNQLYHALKTSGNIRFVSYTDPEALMLDQQKGRIAGTIHIFKTEGKAAPY